MLDEGRFGRIEPKFGLPGFFVEAVALEAVFGEDRADVAVEIELLCDVLFSGERKPETAKRASSNRREVRRMRWGRLLVMSRAT